MAIKDLLVWFKLSRCTYKAELKVTMGDILIYVEYSQSTGSFFVSDREITWITAFLYQQVLVDLNLS